MAKDSKSTTEQMKILTESVTQFSIGNKVFMLQEMSIKRSQQFVRKIAEKAELLKGELGKDLAEIDFQDLLVNKGEILFEHLADMFNFVFGYKTDEPYEPATVDWVSDNVSIRLVGVIVKEIARQSQMEWLIPFFRERFLNELRSQGVRKG